MQKRLVETNCDFANNSDLGYQDMLVANHKKKMPLEAMDGSAQDVDFFLNVLEMFRGWLVAAKDRLAERKDENDALLASLESRLGKFHNRCR